MNCDDAKLWLSADLDGEATVAERAAVQAHLASCSSCRAAGAAAASLRAGLLSAGWPALENAARDEQLLTTLRRMGVIRSTENPPTHYRDNTAIRLRRAFQSYLPLVAPAAATMAAGFLLMWGSLHMAVSGKLGSTVSPSAQTAATPARAPERLQDGWPAQPSTLTSLLQGSRSWAWESEPQPSAPRAPLRLPPAARPRRGAIPGQRPRVG
jgi:predicted anti-sigma-YlaC factor YlaD